MATVHLLITHIIGRNIRIDDVTKRVTREHDNVHVLEVKQIYCLEINRPTGTI